MTSSLPAYLTDPLTLEFEAQILETFPLPGQRQGILLDQTYFYPTGGGQEHDTGFLGESAVLDVYKDDAGRIVHVVADLPPGPRAAARIDHDRRLRHTQHHTVQHLLSQCFLQLLEIRSVSVNINGYSPSTLDLAVAALSKADVQRVEDQVNAIIQQDRPVKSYFVTPEELKALPVRWPPAVSENIRIVEIDGYDYTPFGGTHCTSTGMIGLLKILKVERQNEKTRLSFVAGRQALQVFQQYQETLLSLAAQMSIHFQETPAAVQRLNEQLQAAQKELQALRLERLGFEAQRLAQAARPYGARRVATAAFENRPQPELRLLADELRRTPDLLAVMSTWDGQKLSLIVACGPSSGSPSSVAPVDARAILKRLLAPFNGRGGGEASLAQGGAPASAPAYQAFAAQLPAAVEGILAGNL